MATAKGKGKGLSKTATWIIISTVLIGTGLGLYFLLRKPKEGEEESEDSSDTGSGDTGGTKSSGGGYTAPPELNTTDKIKAFQDWMDKQGKGWIEKDGKWVLLKGGSGYGSYGKYTDAVWKVYGKKYLEESDKSPSSSSKSTSDVDYIAKSSKVSGDKAKKSYLNSTNQDFVKAWANALKGEKNAFIWSNQVYRSDKGDKVLDYNPLKYSFVAKSGSQGSTKPHSGYAYPVSEGTKLGKAKGIDFNKQLWLYLPDNSDYFKWYRIDFIKKSSSSFEGIEYEPTSSFTSKDLDLNL